MSDAAKDAFKMGFLTRCAEEGLTGEKLDARVAQLEKNADALGFVDGAKLLGQAAAGAYALPIATSLLGGGALGWGAAKMMEPEVDEEKIKAQELAHAYKVYGDRIKARRAAKQYRPSV